MWERRRRQSSVWNTHQDQTNCIGWDMILMLWKRWQFHMKLWLSITQQQFHINKIGENIYTSQPVESFTSKNSKKTSLSLSTSFVCTKKNFVKKKFFSNSIHSQYIPAIHCSCNNTGLSSRMISDFSAIPTAFISLLPYCSIHVGRIIVSPIDSLAERTALSPL